MNRFARIASLLLALALILAPLSTAIAGALGDAEKAGLVGERWDGYLGVVEGKGSKEIQKLVAEINAKRKKEYEKVAAKNKISVAEVAKIAGRKLLKGTKPGRYVMPSEGKWVVK
jgi:uncharacterized protein YdbL (DUF1318 family)